MRSVVVVVIVVIVVVVVLQERRELLKRLRDADDEDKQGNVKCVRLSEVVGITSSPEVEPEPGAAAEAAAPAVEASLSGTLEVTVAGATHVLQKPEEGPGLEAPTKPSEPPRPIEIPPETQPPESQPALEEPPETQPPESQPAVEEPSEIQPHESQPGFEDEPSDTQPAFGDVLRLFGVDVSQSGIVDVGDSLPR